MPGEAVVKAFAAGAVEIDAQPLPLAIDHLVPGSGPWEMEVGFGKGRFLLEQAAQRPLARFLGIEVASRYFRLASRRAGRRGLDNVLLLHGEALYLMATHLPRAFAAALHVYFPDPWPKSRHNKRRLFDAESVDLLLARLEDGGTLYFATDDIEYGESVQELLGRHPRLRLEVRQGPWPEGPRTNYEAKYMREGRAIVRLEARLGTVAGRRQEPQELLHPSGAASVLVAPRCTAGAEG